MLSIDRYELRVDIHRPLGGIPDAPGRISVSGEITLRNSGRHPVSRATLLLYRLLDLDDLGDPDGVRQITWRQHIRGLRDLPELQVNVVTLAFDQPLGDGEPCTLALSYSGPVVGYREVFPYAHDAVERDRMLLRREVLWHPIAASPTVDGFFSGLLAPAQFVVQAVLPDGWWGTMPQIPSTFDATAHTCRVSGESAGLSLVGGQFEHVQSGSGGGRVVVHASPQHRDWAARVAAAIRVTTERLGMWVGESPRHGDPWDVIEVPAYWGSEVTPFAVLMQYQTDDRDVFREAAHETAHRWAVPAGDRFCDESLAHYLETLVLTSAWGDAYREEALNDWRAKLRAARDASATPIEMGAQRGHGFVDPITRLKGPLALAVLHGALGDTEFLRLLHDWFTSSDLVSRTVSDFAAHVARAASARFDASRYIGDWFLETRELSTILPDRTLTGDAVEKPARQYRR